MRQVAAQLEKILQMPGISVMGPTSVPSSVSSEVIDQVELLMSQTKHHYWSQEPPLETLRVWAPVWVKLANEYGLEAMRRALETHKLASEFFPLPAHISRLLEAERRPANGLRANKPSLPLTRRELAKLVGDAVAAEATVATADDVRAQLGRKAAEEFQAKLDAEERGSQCAGDAVTNGGWTIYRGSAARGVLDGVDRRIAAETCADSARTCRKCTWA